mmetsp:Transcript_28231/g.59631  ORF Transcript_28231/g.59631 Transcript_28231/m.59631 type:complete len:106 (+) Transcript_28231:264-581(+)
MLHGEKLWGIWIWVGLVLFECSCVCKVKEFDEKCSRDVECIVTLGEAWVKVPTALPITAIHTVGRDDDLQGEGYMVLTQFFDDLPSDDLAIMLSILVMVLQEEEM